MLADLVVLDRDPLACPPDELPEIGVVATMLGGRWVHGAERLGDDPPVEAESVADPLRSEPELRELYGEPSEVVKRKVIDHVDPHARRFIELSPFCCLGTSSEEGGDVSPRGDHPGFVRVLSETAAPDPRPDRQQPDRLAVQPGTAPAGRAPLPGARP